MFPVLDHVEIVAPDTSLSVTNPLAQVSMYQCSVSTPGSPAVFCNSAQIDAIECDFRAKDDQLAVFFTAGTYSFRDCRFVGVITLAAVTAAVFDGCNISSSGSAAFLLADGSPLTVRRSTIDNPFSMTVAGSGSYSFVDNDFPSGLQSIDTNVGSSPIYVNRSHTEFEFKGIAPLYVITQLFDLYTRDTLGADNTIQLPALNTVPLGTRLTIKKTGVKTTGSITLTTSAGNTIDSGLSFLLQSGALTSVEVEAGVTDWRVLNRSVAIQTGSGLFKNGVTPAPILATIGTKSVILVTRRLPNTGLPGIGIPTVTTPPVGSAGTAFTVEAQDPATNIPVATDQSNFDWAVIG